MTDEQAARKWCKAETERLLAQRKGDVTPLGYSAFLAGAAHGREEAAKVAKDAASGHIKLRELAEAHGDRKDAALHGAFMHECMLIAAAIRNQQETP